MQPGFRCPGSSAAAGYPLNLLCATHRKIVCQPAQPAEATGDGATQNGGGRRWRAGHTLVFETLAVNDWSTWVQQRPRRRQYHLQRMWLRCGRLCGTCVPAGAEIARTQCCPGTRHLALAHATVAAQPSPTPRVTTLDTPQLPVACYNDDHEEGAEEACRVRSCRLAPPPARRYLHRCGAAPSTRSAVRRRHPEWSRGITQQLQARTMLWRQEPRVGTRRTPLAAAAAPFRCVCGGGRGWSHAPSQRWACGPQKPRWCSALAPHRRPLLLVAQPDQNITVGGVHTSVTVPGTRGGGGQGGCWARTHCITCRWPPSAARLQVSASRGQGGCWLSRHCNSCRSPALAAALQVSPSQAHGGCRLRSHCTPCSPHAAAEHMNTLLAQRPVSAPAMLNCVQRHGLEILQSEGSPPRCCSAQLQQRHRLSSSATVVWTTCHGSAPNTCSRLWWQQGLIAAGGGGALVVGVLLLRREQRHLEAIRRGCMLRGQTCRMRETTGRAQHCLGALVNAQIALESVSRLCGGGGGGDQCIHHIGRSGETVLQRTVKRQSWQHHRWCLAGEWQVGGQSSHPTESQRCRVRHRRQPAAGRPNRWSTKAHMKRPAGAKDGCAC